MCTNGNKQFKISALIYTDFWFYCRSQFLLQTLEKIFWHRG